MIISETKNFDIVIASYMTIREVFASVKRDA